MADEILRVTGVSKAYAKVRAVDDVSLSVQRGEIYALLGPNGAGKTTLVRMLLGILAPDTGEVSFGFENGGTTLDTSRIGYLPEERGLYPDLPIRDTLVYLGTLREMSQRDARRETGRWLERFELADRAGDKLSTLSKGNQQKVQFIASVLHRPELAILDEPFSGLDPVNQSRFLDLLRELRDDGMTILLSAHQMNLVERIADRILLIARGKPVLRGTLAEIRAGSDVAHRLYVQPGEGSADPSALLTEPGVRAWEATDEDGALHLLLEPDADLGSLLGTVGTHLRPRDIRLERMDLHDIYVAAVSEAGLQSVPGSDTSGEEHA